MKIGDSVRLVAVTFKGRKELQRNGEYGVVQATENAGMWLYVTAAGGRWVKGRGDTNFVVVEA